MTVRKKRSRQLAFDSISNSLDCDVAIFAIERIGRYRAELGRECKEGEKGNKEFGSLLARHTERNIEGNVYLLPLFISYNELCYIHIYK